ncbi:MAG: tetratricopeptide repeat protein, partial [Alphaproteobacteria bacterium]
MNRKERRQREKLRRTRGASPLPEGLQEAVSLHQTGRIRDALPLYQKFLAERPDHPDALNYCGLAIYQLGDAGQALNLISAAIQAEPTNAGAYNNLGLVFQKLGRMDEAEGAYRHALKLQPKASQVHSNLGNILQTNGKFDESVAAYRRAIAIKPDSAEALNNLGNVLKKQRKLDEALSAYKSALKYWPDNPDTHNNLGVLLQAAGKLEEAITNFEHSLKIKPDNAEAYFNLGGVYRELGRIDEAIDAYQRAIELKPDLNVYDNLGSLLLDGGALNKQTPALRQVIENPEENPAACANLAGLLADGDDLDGAEALARQAMKANGHLPDAAASLAKALVEKGKLKEALAAYEGMPKTVGQNLASHINFAVALLRQQWIGEGIKVIDSIIAEPQLTANQRYALFVNKGIYAWLEEDFAKLGDCLQACNALGNVIDRTTIDASLCIYQLYLERLLQYREANPALYTGSAEGEIHVIGESHALSPNGTVVTFEGKSAKIVSHLLIGCKAWHLTQPLENYFQRGFRSALRQVPQQSTVVACFGEIDCRHNEGIFHHYRKRGGDLDEIIRTTVEAYVAFVMKAAAKKKARLFFSGVPAPHPERPALGELTPEDRKAYLEVIAGFNRQLKEAAEANGVAFLMLAFHVQGVQVVGCVLAG